LFATKYVVREDSFFVDMNLSLRDNVERKGLCIKWDNQNIHLIKTMNNSKDKVITSIEKAKEELAEALSTLEAMPSFDPADVQFNAHQVSNYLSVTSCTIDFLLGRLKEHPDKKVIDLLESLSHANNFITHTVLGLMSDYSSEKLEFKRKRVDLPFVVQKACDYYQRLAKRKQISINYECKVDQPYVWTDRVAVAAVLDNLLSNAVKYSEPGKQIWVQITSNSSELVCSVEDEGPGISLEDQDKLFHKGVTLGHVPTGGESSTGYGLAVAKHLIDNLGGKVWCESKPFKGSKFSFSLPKYAEDINLSVG